ncbi:MAG: winged helix-turn-helix domain-containing protein [Candidatus Bathyarchaeota archaeon]|nr:winged helix-turn-helix domain-containing protein [Candidatus Bathyarchaeota archaeon]
MDEINEEVYSTIFNALRHGVRRNILRMLNDQELSFSTMEERLGLSSSHLTYHLDSLNELVSKTANGYKLSLFGEAAVEMIEKVEEPPRASVFQRFHSRTISYALLILVLITSGLYINTYLNTRSLNTTFYAQTSELETASAQLDAVKSLYDLSQIHSFRRYGYGYGNNLMVTSSYSIYYWHDIADYPPDGTMDSKMTFYARFYSPKDNLTLMITPQKYYPLDEFSYPLTLQHGDTIRDWSNSVGINYPSPLYPSLKVYDDKPLAPIIWQENVTSNRKIYITLPECGWYSLCMTGPIYQSINDDDIEFKGAMISERDGVVEIPEHLELWIDFSILDDGDEVFFGVMDNFLYK